MTRPTNAGDRDAQLKLEAYKYLAEIRGITGEYPEPQDETILYIGIPADESVYQEYINRIIDRIHKLQASTMSDFDRQCEIRLLSVLTANILMARHLFRSIPTPDMAGELSQFLSGVYKGSKLDYTYGLLEGNPALSASAMLSAIFSSDPVEFYKKSSKISSKELPLLGLDKIIEQTAIALDTATKFRDFLLGKTNWQIKKLRREPSLNKKIYGSDGSITTFADQLADEDSIQFIKQTDIESDIDRLDSTIDQLPPKEKSAIEEWRMHGKSLTETSQRAKNRAFKKIRSLMKKPLAN